MLGNPKQSWILDSKPWIPVSRHLIPVYSRGTLDWIPILSMIPDSLSCIPDSKVQDSGFHKEKFHGFHNPDSLTWPMLLLTSCYISSIIIWLARVMLIIIISRWIRECSCEQDYWWQWLSIKVNCILSNSAPDFSTKPWCYWSSANNNKIPSIFLKDSKFEWWVSIRYVVFRFDICHFIVSPTFGFCSVSLFNFWL